MSMSPVSTESAAIDLLHGYVLEAVGQDPTAWPGGWPDEIEAALIDAVFSVRARYGSRERKTGVFGAVTRWRDHRAASANDLRVLADTPPTHSAPSPTTAKPLGATRQKSS